MSNICSLKAMGWRPSVADWGCGMSASCTAGPIVRWHDGWPNNALRYH